MIRPILELLYGKEVIGLENLPSEGGCVVVSNHVSWIDGILILWMLPRNVRFVVDGGNFSSRVTQYLAGAFDTILMTSNPKSIARALVTARKGLEAGDVIGLFPEGTLSRSGQLQGFRPGLGRIVKGTDAPVVPMYLEGMWGSVFSYSGGRFFFKWPEKWRRRLTLYVGNPLPGDTPVDRIRSAVHQLAARGAVDHRAHYPILATALISAWRKRGRRTQLVDSTGVKLGGRDALTRALALRRTLAREVFSEDEDHVGILLPPSVGGVIANVSVALDRRVSANLNYTGSSAMVNHCIREVDIRHVLTSERFLSKVDLEIDCELVTLESVAKKVSKVDKLVGFVQANLVPKFLLTRWLGLHRIGSDDLLTIIFTSGSTGQPKGVMLTQANVSHNVDAIKRAIRLDHHDVVLGVLPFFHSFGYSVTLWAANVLGPMSVYHFNPLDGKQVGKLSAQYGVTVILGTPTFVRIYIRQVKPEQFSELDVCVVGAEKMPANLFDAFEERFGIRPVEGYGTTELSPLVSVNIPPSRSSARYQADRLEGSVGRPLPGVCAKVVSLETDEELGAGQDGMLLITGPNVMAGYARQPELTGEVVRSGWYSTGDIAHLDDQGFIHITGRLKRISKIGGEMVPHETVEEEIRKAIGAGQGAGSEDEDGEIAVTAVNDGKKGERLVVLYERLPKDIEQIRCDLKTAGLPNLYIPGRDSFFKVDAIPVLGTGKLDLRAARELADQLAGTETA